MQDHSPIAGFSLTLAGQRVLMHKCGSDPPNAGHLAPMHSTKMSVSSALIITALQPDSAAWSAWRRMRVSALPVMS